MGGSHTPHATRHTPRLHPGLPVPGAGGLRGLFTPDRVLRSMLAHLHAREDRSVSACDQGPLRVQVVGWFRGGPMCTEHVAPAGSLLSPPQAGSRPARLWARAAWPGPRSRAPQEHRPERRLEHRPQTVWSMLRPACSRALPPREPGRARESSTAPTGPPRPPVELSVVARSPRRGGLTEAARRSRGLDA